MVRGADNGALLTHNGPHNAALNVDGQRQRISLDLV